MNPIQRKAPRHPIPTEQEFELMAVRYIVVPGLLWGLAALALLVTISLQPAAQPLPMATTDDVAATVFHGA